MRFFFDINQPKKFMGFAQPTHRGCLKSLDSSSLRVFISGEQTKETDEKVGSAVNNFCSA
jgi:hypothetical protein